MYFAKDENLLFDWNLKLSENVIKADFQWFMELMRQANLRNSVFVDITASDDVSQIYQ